MAVESPVPNQRNCELPLQNDHGNRLISFMTRHQSFQDEVVVLTRKCHKNYFYRAKESQMVYIITYQLAGTTYCLGLTINIPQ